ncbi:hypothetical protein [Paraburkholderia hayleyella]|uniref:hypothetical protein n=1 Tax=Paraburkholderia hayleyella TaxID=2152889 RepID=UPI00129264B9|nr:hypothetical protein [Paraburkholderia hayleyella]
MTLPIAAVQALPPLSVAGPLPPTWHMAGAAAPAGHIAPPSELAAGQAPEADAIARFRSRLDAAREASATLASSMPSGASVTSHPAGGHGPSAVARIVAEQDHAFSALNGEVNQFSGTVHMMSTQEAVAESMKIQFQVAAMTARLYLGQTVAQGSKNAIQTLMKNQ